MRSSLRTDCSPVTLPLTIILGGEIRPCTSTRCLWEATSSSRVVAKQGGIFPEESKEKKASRGKQADHFLRFVCSPPGIIGTSVPTSLQTMCTTIFTCPPDSMSMTKRPQSECDSHIEVCVRMSFGLGYLTPTKTLIWSYSKLR